MDATKQSYFASAQHRGPGHNGVSMPACGFPHVSTRMTERNET
jgi:hypothetical protein